MVGLVRPFLKWAGNKTAIVARIRAVLPAGQRLIEPFVGSGAVFLNTDYAAYLLADSNPDLINLYRIVQRDGAAFIRECRAYFRDENNTADAYYGLRERFNTTADSQEKAALFVYLNRHCYNGLCRYNSRGEFNVPFGRYRKPYFPAAELAAFHAKSRRAEFCQADFAATMDAAGVGDVIYCDPPYVPLSETANFTSYSTTRFGETEQLSLARLAEQLARRGVAVVISNHDTPFTRAAYAQAQLQSLSVQRNISCNGAKRTRAGELLALFAGNGVRAVE